MVPVSSKSLSASIDLPWSTWAIMEKFLSNKITQMEPAKSTKIIIKEKKRFWNGIYIFQTYLENNAWLHYLILLNSSMLLKHQCSYLHIQEIQLKSFVHKKDYQSLNGMIDLSTYQPVYNIKIIYDIYTLKLTQQYSNLQYSFMISQKKYKMNWSISTKSPHLSAALS